MARIYLASSWRNPYQPEVLGVLRDWGHAVYDFREHSVSARQWRKESHSIGSGEPYATAFKWTEVDPDWQSWNPETYRQQIMTSGRAAHGYTGDLRGMEWADTCVMLLPCGNSAHIEAGFMKGRGKRLIIHWFDNKPSKFEPDLMYLAADNITIGEGELKHALNDGNQILNGSRGYGQRTPQAPETIEREQQAGSGVAGVGNLSALNAEFSTVTPPRIR